MLSFSGGVMIVTDNARNLPRAVFVLPQMNELPFTNGLFVVISRVMKAMHTHFNRAVSFHVIDLQCSWNKLAGDFAADILFHAIGQISFAQRYAPLVMIKLHVIDKK